MENIKEEKLGSKKTVLNKLNISTYLKAKRLEWAGHVW